MSIFESASHHHIPGLITNIIAKKKATKGKYIFYFTGGNKEHLLNGIEIDLDLKMNPQQCSNYLLNSIKKIIDTTNMQLIVYLPGGIPFISGTLAKIFESETMNTERVIYGVLTRRIKDAILNKSFPELCNISDPDRKLFISPLVDSTDRGLSDMACLMGYLNHDGVKSDLLRRTCASVIHFPPLITSMSRIIDRNQDVGRDIVTVTSTLYTFFRSYIPKSCPNNKVYEYGLRMCNLISHINDPPEKLPMMTLEVKSGQSSTKLFSDLKLGPIVYFWKGDTGEDFPWFNLKLQSETAIERANSIIASFTPIAPLSVRNATGCSIVKGKEHEYLYLMQSALKDEESQNKVDIINPMTGMTETKDIESFSIEQENDQVDNIENLIDPERVKQIIMVNFDESKSMIGDIKGVAIPKGSKESSRVTIANQYLTIFANKTYGYRIPCIQGLISFNNNIKIRCPLSPLVPDFDKGLKNISPTSVTRLWDSLLKSCEEIIKFRIDESGKEKYPLAVSRIIVISDGEDSHSESSPEKVVKELIRNKIIVDSIIINRDDDCKMLCAVSHATGGLSFRPGCISDGYLIFEKSAFLNFEERKIQQKPLIATDNNTLPRNLKIDKITKEFMEKARDCAIFDELEDIQNKELNIANTKSRLATPLHVCSENAHTEIPSPRHRRILRELHAAAEINDPESKKYDPEMQIYTYHSNLDRWKVYLKGLDGTPYGGKWWYLYVTFPELYPVEPPVFRFITVPYHLNVSLEGRICLNSIEKGYMSTKPVVEILQQIKELFLYPNPDTPVQIDMYIQYLHQPEKYYKFAKYSDAHNDVKDYLEGFSIDASVNRDFRLEFTEYIPPYMRSQISGKYIPPDRLVMASSGVYYDKEELKQLISSNINPICVITGKQLTETLEDLEDECI